MLPAVATLGCEPVHYEIFELRRRPGNSVNAHLWVGVQGVVAPEFIIRPNFLTSIELTFFNKLFYDYRLSQNILEYPELAF
ncbi:hypothetical protein [Leptospira noguchii]|uniref:hypothetical protein n=1 Tax=Leptospira noguchii TaxID=28182 RepID=UPI0018DEEB38|nr:hypothetical protein [Leptospira noguchii]